MGGRFVKALAYLALFGLVALTSCQAAMAEPVAAQSAAQSAEARS